MDLKIIPEIVPRLSQDCPQIVREIVPEIGFTYNGVKFLPIQMRETKNIQNYDKRSDMEKRPFILIITIQFIS